jgi:hypothetical protein
MINLVSANASLDAGGWWLYFTADGGASGTIHNVVHDQMIEDQVVTILDPQGLGLPDIIGSSSGYEYSGVTDDPALFNLATRFYRACRIDKTITEGDFPITNNGLPQNPTNPS